MAKKILIIEDSITTVGLLQSRLEAVGYEVISAFEGQSGLDLMKTKKPDLVLLDVRMPGMDGYEVCRIAKNDPQLKHIPIIFVTTAAQEKDIKKGKEVGGDSYMTKPYDGRELLNEVNKFLK